MPALMDVRERIGGDNMLQMFRLAALGLKSGLWTAIPGIVHDVANYEKEGTVVIQPAIQGFLGKPDGTGKMFDLPLLPDVPVLFMRGGGYTLTFPIAKDDEALVIMASRSIDKWWDSGGVQAPFDSRTHDINDGFALVGPFSRPNALQNLNTKVVQLRSNDGKFLMEVDNTDKKRVYMQADTNSLVMDGQNGESLWSLDTGNLTVRTSGNITAECNMLQVTALGDTKVDASGGVTITAGSSINLNANAGVHIHSVSGATFTASGSIGINVTGDASVAATGATNISGATVNLN